MSIFLATTTLAAVLTTAAPAASHFAVADSATFAPHTRYDEKLEAEVLQRNVRLLSPTTDTSILEMSRACVSAPPSGLLGALLDVLREPQHQWNDAGPALVRLDSLHSARAVEVRCSHTPVLVVEAVLSAVADERSVQVDTVVWVGRYDGSHITETFFCGISVDPGDDRMRRVCVSAVSDIDHDGHHEIVIADVRYAGMWYRVIHLGPSGKRLVKQVHGDSWD